MSPSSTTPTHPPLTAALPACRLLAGLAALHPGLPAAYTAITVLDHGVILGLTVDTTDVWEAYRAALGVAVGDEVALIPASDDRHYLTADAIVDGVEVHLTSAVLLLGPRDTQGGAA
jgi:hypothetical protein